MRVTNQSNISLPLAVWLLDDDYDYIDKPNYVSVTGLMKPLKQTILANRIPKEQRVSDVQDYIARKLGHAIHDSIEKAWVSEARVGSLKRLGYPEAVIDRIKINPTKEELLANSAIIPVYLEQRGFREIEVDGVTFIIGGKFDMVADGELYDNKSTSAFAWLFGTKDDDYRTQGSLYRWVHGDKILGDQIHVNFIFTDWSRAQARQNPKYPQKRVETKSVDLWSEADTEAWIRARLRAYLRYKDLPEDQIPECTDEELWRSDPVFKYYADANKTSGRSTKNFDTLADANAFMASKGGVGIVKTVLGEPKACGYCPAFENCKQKDRYL